MPDSHAMEIPAIPRGAALVSVDGRAYPLKAARIVADASGGVAFSTLVQEYRNPYDEPLEVVYTLPLPADGAVIGYAIRMGQRVIRGEVRGRDEAKAAYEKALFEGRAAGLLEQDRDATFTQRLGSLPARQSAEITIEVLHPVGFLPEGGEVGPQWEYRFPTVVSVRYEGAVGRVPDADRLDIDRTAGPGEIPTRIELTLTTQDDAGAALRRVESMRLDRDLVVRWPAGGTPSAPAALVEGPGFRRRRRYGLLTITPPRSRGRAFAHVLRSCDARSMSAPNRLGEGRRRGLLRSLGAGDRFRGDRLLHAARIADARARRGAGASVRRRRGRSRSFAGGGRPEMGTVVEALRPLRRTHSIRSCSSPTDRSASRTRSSGASSPDCPTARDSTRWPWERPPTAR
jgi:Ca-activated chloride channel family protein